MTACVLCHSSSYSAEWSWVKLFSMGIVYGHEFLLGIKRATPGPSCLIPKKREGILGDVSGLREREREKDLYQ